MRRILPFVLSLALAVTLALPAVAGSLGGVDMPNTATVGGEKLVLNGMALRKKLFIKVYVAGLYLPTKQTSAPAVLKADGPRHLRMEFLRGVTQEQVCDAWNEGLEANTANPSSALKGQFKTLCSYMVDVDEGDHYGFTYLPGKGTEVSVNGKTKGTLEGKAFADALFASWIGEHPGPGDDFREDLMGN